MKAMSREGGGALEAPAAALLQWVRRRYGHRVPEKLHIPRDL